MRFVWWLAIGLGCGARVEPLEGDPELVVASNAEPSFIGGGCAGHDTCYRICRLQYTCAPPTWSGCGPLSDCLTRCDISFPGC